MGREGRVRAVPEEATKEVAATGEQPPRGPASPEFFFLLERIDRLDERLTREIKAGDEGLLKRMDRLDEKLTREIKAGDDRLAAEIRALDEKLPREIKAGDERLAGEINALDKKMDSLRFWAIGAVITLLAGFAATIATLLACP